MHKPLGAPHVQNTHYTAAESHLQLPTLKAGKALVALLTLGTSSRKAARDGHVLPFNCTNNEQNKHKLKVHNSRYKWNREVIRMAGGKLPGE